MGDWSMSMTLSRCSSPSIVVIPARLWRAPGTGAGRWPGTACRSTRLDLPEPLTPVTTMKLAQREAHVEIAQIVLAGPAQDQIPRHCRRRRSAGMGIWRRPDRYAPVRLFSSAATPSGVPAAHDLAAMLARARAQIDQPIGRVHRLLVVLDHQHRVAQVAQVAERADQPGVVALVQADARLVQDVEHAHQLRADLRGQADALRLAAAERAGLAVEREIIQPDIEHEAQPGLDFLEHLPGDRPIPLATGARRQATSSGRGAL